ncbi:transcription initiation factor IID, 31kD subunit-domain-containing protein [Staphylotrichum tortipilum]|uniref:Transcription initiation factor IID, 31kD subunit-domain-containing protein n=1 Tax=Staphylotrichum tortipilum TaxID=2831512 RepID=A0AAN6MTS4_9PEZI|nr:transcription initiation factor IID, 31kD subunit-domain-containing protein [Staphylotrichum longicolle]
MSAVGAAAPQTNGVPPSQTPTSTQQPQSQQASQSQPAAATPSQSQQQPPQQPQNHLPSANPGGAVANPSTTAPRPRDVRTMELLLTAQGVTSFEQRVPLLLLDFAYRHTSSILLDALHLAADPYTSHAGARPSAAAGAAPVNVGDATISSNAVQVAIGSRLGFQFRGGGGAGGIGGGGGGGASKDWLMELARERNKVALPRVMPSEWGVRLPGERFVLSGVSWGLRDVWAGQEGADESSEEEEDEDDVMMLDGGKAGGADAMEVEEDVGGEGVEGGTMGDVFGNEGMDEDEEMAEA